MGTDVDDGEFTELVDPDIPRVDAVKGGANGTRFLIAKSADEQPAGLFDPDFVRDLVAKAEDEQQADTGRVTVTGSPTAVAAMMARIHGAPVRKAEKYNTEDRKHMAANGQAMDDGSYPIADAEDVHNAVHAVGRGDNNSHNAIRRHVMARAKALGESEQIPDTWAANGSLKQPVSKADGESDPGSPAWEAQDTDSAEQLVQAVLALRPRIEAFAAREGAEVAAGEMGDLGDVFDLQAARDCLMQAAKLIGGVAVAERAESGAEVAKAATTTPAAHAAPNPQESTVTNTDTDGVRQAEQTAPTAEQGTAPAEVAKSGVAPLTEAELAQIGRDYLLKKAAKAAAKTSGASGAPDGQARVIPGTDTVQAPAVAQDEVAKSAANQIATAVAQAMAPVVKQVADLTTLVGSQSERVEKALAQPDDRRSPLLNGATGEPGLALRGGKSPVDSDEFQAVRKAISEMPDGPAKEELQRKVGISAIIGRFSG